MTATRKLLDSRYYVFCTNGHEMVSVPRSRSDAEAKAHVIADEDGCGYGRCDAKRAS